MVIGGTVGDDDRKGCSVPPEAADIVGVRRTPGWRVVTESPPLRQMAVKSKGASWRPRTTLLYSGRDAIEA
jgi:hypothetical protein